MRAIICAAGTAGHINPALSIANTIMEKEPDSEILFIGTTYGLENDLVPRAGYNFKQIEAYGFKKQISFTNFKHIIQTFASTGKVRKIIREFKPDVVIGTGGYVCVPVMRAAIKENIKTVLHESNAFPGMAIKMFDGKASKILVGFEKTRDNFNHKDNVIYVGNPTKMKDINYSKEEKEKILNEIGLKLYNEDGSLRKTIIEFGGSQGAQRINDATTDLIISKKGTKLGYNLIWAIGPKQYDKYVNIFKENDIDIENDDEIKVFNYIYNMEELLNVADFAITRAGAMTITELSIVGIPAIFIPLPSRNANKQVDNAKIFEKANAGKIILNSDITKDTLEEKITSMLDSNLEEMSKNAKKLAPSNVLGKIYDEILTILK